jgi:peptide/nickel transport system permease protein
MNFVDSDAGVLPSEGLDVASGSPEAATLSSRVRATLRWAVRWPSFTFGVVVSVAFCLIAIAAPLLAPYPPDVQNSAASLVGPSLLHPFGTDEFGRDILSRIFFGARLTLLASSAAMIIAAVVGNTIGLTAGYFGSVYDAITGRLIDALFAFPVILLAIAIVAMLGPGEPSVVIAIAIASVPNFARVSRAAMLAEKERDYVLSAYAIGASTPYIIVRKLLPNLAGPLLVLASLGFAYAVLYEASLSFLGIGAQPPTPEWGEMLASAREFLFQDAWYSFFPGVSIFLLVFSLNLIGDGLRDLVDPHRQMRR